ncbi:hypothetical protein XANCAGTX0491_006932 [Xanthoria calcicola]
MAPQNDKPPTSTTNVILGVTLSFGIVALVLGLYLIYKAYMRYLKYQQNSNLHPHGRSQNSTSAQKATDETLLRDKYTDPGRRMPSQNSLRDWKQRPIDMRETGRDYTNGNATDRLKETSDSSRGRRVDGGQRAESLHGKRVRGRPPAPRPQRVYQARPRRARSVGPLPFSSGPYPPAGFQSKGQYPYQGPRNFNAFRDSYPTQLPGQDAFGRGWTHESMAHRGRPRSAMPPMNKSQPPEAANLYPNYPNTRLGTPLNPASEVSHFISALDTESLHDRRNQRVEHTNDGARSFQSVEDRHDNRSSTSGRRGSNEGSGHGSRSGSSSRISGRGDAKYDNEVERGDGDIPGAPQTEGHQGPDKANNEAW